MSEQPIERNQFCEEVCELKFIKYKDFDIMLKNVGDMRYMASGAVAKFLTAWNYTIAGAVLILAGFMLHGVVANSRASDAIARNTSDIDGLKCNFQQLNEQNNTRLQQILMILQKTGGSNER